MGDKSNANRVDFKDPRLKSAIENWNLISFLDDYKVDYAIEGKNIGRNFIGVNPCPFCKDDHNHFAIHEEEKFGTCFICKGYAHPLKIISYFGRMSFKKAFDYLLGQTIEQQDIIKRVDSILKNKKRQIDKKEITIDSLPKNRLITPQDLKNGHLKSFFEKRKLHICHIKK